MRRTDLILNLNVGDNIFSCVAVVTKALKRECFKEYADEIPKDFRNKGSYSNVINYLDEYIEVADIEGLG